MTAMHQYHVEAVSERTAARVRLSHGKPMTHEEAIRFRDRFTPHPMRRLQLCPADAAPHDGEQPAGEERNLMPAGASASPACPDDTQRRPLPPSR